MIENTENKSNPARPFYSTIKVVTLLPNDNRSICTIPLQSIQSWDYEEGKQELVIHLANEVDETFIGEVATQILKIIDSQFYSIGLVTINLR